MGAFMNVRINAAGYEDKAYVAVILGRGRMVAQKAEELEREMMEGDGEVVEPRGKEGNSDPLLDGSLDCNDEVDSLFGDPLESEL